MKKRINLLVILAIGLLTLCLAGCTKKYTMWVSSQDVRFGLEANTQTIVLRANCKWTISLTDDEDWYTISPMSGNANDSIITITVKEYNGDYRGTSFVIDSPGGHVHRTVFVAQTYINFYSLINKVFGVMNKERWNTDYADQMIEDSYVRKEYDPYDTTRGYHMYFLEGGIGMQRDHHTDTVAYWLFYYEYDPVHEILHIDFPADTTMNYAPEVLSASDSLYRFMHEFKPHYWERADMRKVGIIVPESKSDLLRKAVKRKESGPIFMD